MGEEQVTEEKLTCVKLGEAVHYVHKHEDGCVEMHAALVAKVHRHTVDLVVLDTDECEGVLVKKLVKHCPAGTPGTYHLPCEMPCEK